jgi:hypothetical protein
MTQLCKVFAPSDLTLLSPAINVIDSLPERHTALRLQATEFICELSKLFRRYENQSEAQPIIFKLLEYVIKGFRNPKLTLIPSAECFRIFVPLIGRLIEEILDPDLVE